MEIIGEYMRIWHIVCKRKNMENINLDVKGVIVKKS